MSENILLKRYATFLYHNLIEEVYSFYLSRNKEISLPILNFYRQYSNQDSIRKESEQFILQLMEWKIFKDIKDWIDHLNEINILLFEGKEIKISDVILLLGNRKNTVLNFIPSYSKDMVEVMELVKEIEHYFSVQEQIFIASFDKMHQMKEGELKSKLSSTEKEVNEYLDFIEKEESLTHVGHFVLDFKSGKIQCSEEFYKIFGIALGSNVDFDVLNKMTMKENGYNPFSTDLTQSFAGSKPNIHEFKIRRQDQIIRMLQSQDFPVLNVEGKVIGIKSFVQDITDLKGVEKKAEESESLLNQIIENSPTLIFIYNLEKGKITFVNKEAQRYLGFQLDYLLGLNIPQSLDVLVYEEDRERIRERIKNYSNSDSDKFQTIEYRLLDSERNIHWVYSNAMVFKRDDGNVKEILVNAIDITPLKSAKEQLAFREDQLLTAQKIAHLGSFEWNLDSGDVTATQELYRIFNFPSNKKLNAKDFLPYANKAELNRYKRLWLKSCKENVPFEGEFTITFPDNSVKYVLSRSIPVFNKSGKVVKRQGAIMDITSLVKVEKEIEIKNEEILQANRKLKAAELDLKKINAELEERVRHRTKELKESQERYQVLIKQSSIGFCRFEFRDIPYIDTTLSLESQMRLIQKHNYIAEANDYLAHLLGHESSDELIGRQLADYFFISEEKIKEILSAIVYSGYNVHEVEIIEKSEKANPLHVLINIIGVVEENKLLRGWGIIRDVTAKRLAERALKESEERYKILSEAHPSIIWTARPDGGLDFFNQRTYDYSGATFDELKDWRWQEHVHPDDIENSMRIWMHCLENGTNYEVEYRLRRYDGTYRWHIGRALPFKDKKGNIIKWIGSSIDIEDQKNSEEKLKQKNEDLDSFIYMASHDLKAPIANIEGLLNALNVIMSEQESKVEGVSDIIEMIDTSIVKFKKNLLELIEITKAEQVSEGNIKENYLLNIVEEVKIMLVEQIKTSNAKIETDFRECDKIKFSKKNLQSILYNLLSNAIKYRSPDRTPDIFIATKPVDGYIELSVQDNGLGFEPDQVDKVLSEFKRLHKDIEGSGVGLYIIKRIITNAGGKIEVESEKGKGSIFKVFFKV